MSFPALVPSRRALVAAAVALACLAPAQPASADEQVVSGDWKMTLPLGLQKDAAFVPEGNTVSVDKIELGRALYFDPRLSKDDTVSCATCHGDVAQRPVLFQEKSTSMNTCMACHAEAGAPNGCDVCHASQ